MPHQRRRIESLLLRLWQLTSDRETCHVTENHHHAGGIRGRRLGHHRHRRIGRTEPPSPPPIPRMESRRCGAFGFPNGHLGLSIGVDRELQNCRCDFASLFELPQRCHLARWVVGLPWLQLRVVSRHPNRTGNSSATSASATTRRMTCWRCDCQQVVDARHRTGHDGGGRKVLSFGCRRWVGGCAPLPTLRTTTCEPVPTSSHPGDLPRPPAHRRSVPAHTCESLPTSA